jgi:flagellar export protein FliJ
MADALAALIRLQRWTVDEGRRTVIAAMARLDQLQADARELTANIAREQACARDDEAIGLLSYAPFAQRMIAAEAALAVAIAESEAALADARDTLAAAYREQRKLERVASERQRHRAAARARREQDAIDEIALRRAGSAIRTRAVI